MLINGKIDIDFVKRYPEIQNDCLMIQAEMFKQTTNASTLQEAKNAYQKMHPEVRNLFPQVALLMKFAFDKMIPDIAIMSGIILRMRTKLFCIKEVENMA